MAPGPRSKSGAPMLEPEVLRKQMYWLMKVLVTLLGLFGSRGIVSPSLRPWSHVGLCCVVISGAAVLPYLPLWVAWIISILVRSLSMYRSLVPAIRLYFGGLDCSRLQMLPSSWYCWSYALLQLNMFLLLAFQHGSACCIISGSQERCRISQQHDMP